MLELLKATRILGVRHLLRLRRAQVAVWPNLIKGHVITRVLQTLLNVGFFDELRRSGSINAAQFAASRNLDESILRSLCEALYASAILDKDGETYTLSATGELIVHTGRGWLNGVYGYEDLYNNLESMLRQERRYGVDVHRKTDFVARGTGQIENELYFPLAIDIIRDDGYRHVLDLGCGDGTFLRHACKALPSIRGYGVDIARDALDDARRLTAEAKLAERIHFDALDVTGLEQVPLALKGVDVATAFFLLHEFLHNGPDAVVWFLQSFRHLFPNVPLIVFEVDRPSPEAMRKSHAGMAIPYYLHHDLSHQRPIGRQAWVPMFKAAGFRDIAERHLGYARSVIFTLR